jgi:hypothetical protein
VTRKIDQKKSEEEDKNSVQKLHPGCWFFLRYLPIAYTIKEIVFDLDSLYHYGTSVLLHMVTFLGIVQNFYICFTGSFSCIHVGLLPT